MILLFHSVRSLEMLRLIFHSGESGYPQKLNKLEVEVKFGLMLIDKPYG